MALFVFEAYLHVYILILVHTAYLYGCILIFSILTCVHTYIRAYLYGCILILVHFPLFLPPLLSFSLIPALGTHRPSLLLIE